jgi:hypothetical protein
LTIKSTQVVFVTVKFLSSNTASIQEICHICTLIQLWIFYILFEGIDLAITMTLFTNSLCARVSARKEF